MTNPDFETQMVSERQKELETAEAIRDVIKEMDLDNNGTITLDEIVNVKNPGLINLLALHGITVMDTVLFFRTLAETAESDVLDVDSFVAGCMKLRGPATNLDLQNLIFQVEQLARDINRVYRDVHVSARGGPAPAITSRQRIQSKTHSAMAL